MPALIAHYQHRALETSFKKSYSVISQATQRFINDEGYIPNAENFKGLSVRNLISSYFVGVIDCFNEYSDSGMSTKCVSSESFSTWFNSFYKTYNKKTLASRAHWWFDDGMFVVTDGSFIFFDNSSSEDLLIGVDINGEKAPNLLGHDVFLFVVDHETGAVKGYDGNNLSGNNDSKYCDKNANSSLNGMGCTVEALKNPDEYFKNLP